MAGILVDNGDQWERIKMVRRLRELFHGRFTDANCKILLRHHDWDIAQTVSFVLDAPPGDVRTLLADNDPWQKVERVRRDDVLKDLARRNQIGAEIRQFTCMACCRMWWRKVPTRKMVSQCNTCCQRYDALPRAKEYGWAKFVCPHPCGHEFHAFGAMDVSSLNMGLTGKSKSICYTCQAQLCEPLEILPPLKGNRKNGRPKNTHWCTARNCFNFHNPGHVPIVPICVHPQSLRRMKREIIEPSTSHVSTGSTVKTFLTQDELAPPYSPYEPSLTDISEDDG